MPPSYRAQRSPHHQVASNKLETNESYYLSEESEEGQSSPLDSFDPSKLLFIFKKSVIYIILCFVLAGAGGFLFLRYTKPVYEATARIKIDVQSSKEVLNFDLGSFSSGFEELKLDGEMQIINSEPVFRGVLDTLNLSVSYYRTGEILDDERYPNPGFILEGESSRTNTPFYINVLDDENFELSYNEGEQVIVEKYQFGQQVNNSFLNAVVRKTEQGSFSEEALGKYKIVFNSKNALIGFLREGLSVRIYNAQSNTLEIIFEGNNPSKAVDIIQAVIDNYWIESQKKKNLAYQQSLEYIAQQSVMAQDTLSAYEQEMGQFRAAERAMNNDGKEEVLSSIRELEGQLREATNRLGNLELLRQLVEADSSYDYISYAASFLGNPEISSLISQAALSMKEIERLESIYEKSTKKEVMKETFGNQKREILEKLDFSINQIEQRRNKVRSQMRRIQSQLVSPQSIDPELKRMQRFYSTYEKIYFVMLNKQVEIGIAKSSTVPNFRVIAYPNASGQPIYPIGYVVYGAVAGLGLFFSVIILAMRYVLHNKLNNPQDLTDRIKVPMLGIVPKYYKRDMEYSQLVVNLSPKSAISESLRSIRTNLDFMLAPAGKTTSKRKNKVLTVTSTISGEGKTFVALNMSGIMAMANAKTILIDLDLRKPKVHKAFGIENTIGITSILAGREGIEDCLRHTPIETLKYLTAGPVPPNPSELLMSDQFNELLDKLKEQYDVIVLDTPPIGLVTDGLLTMRHATNPIYVLRAGYSKVSFTENVNKIANMRKFPNLCVVFNAASNQNTYGKYGQNGYGYGYSYGYGYGYYEEDEPEPKPWWQFWKKHPK